jgi:hypothetical protein
MIRSCLVLVALSVPAAVVQAGHGDAHVSKAIDAEIAAALKEAKLTPAGPAEDASFVRRAHLDLLGRVPTAEETRAFLADRSADRHGKLIDSLLDHKEMPSYWSLVLHAWLNGRSPDPGFGYPEFRAYLEASLAKNKRWDVLARELLVPGGDTQPASFFLASRLKGSKEDRVDAMTVAVASTFFGVRLECAKCHDHPYFKEWKQEHYYGLGAFLHRTESANRGGKPALSEKGNGELTYQDRGRKTFTAKMKFLDDKIIAEGKSGRRQALADHALNAKTPYFKRAVVNRVWKQLMGIGLVEPVDQIHSANRPSHPKLFDLLADDFAANGFDLKRLLAVILHTEVYRRGSAWVGEQRPRDNLYAVAVLRPLTPEQLALSMLAATGHAEVLAKARKGGAQAVRSEIDKEVRSFIQVYETDGDGFAVTTQQALFLTFNKSTQKYLAPAGDNMTARLVKAKDADVAKVAFLSVLSREPTKDEAAEVAAYLKTSGVPRAQLCREIAWALLTGAEFRFNH